MPKFIFNTASTIEVISLDTIYCISVIQESTTVVFEDKVLQCSDTIGKLEKVLSEYSFYRCHKSHVVNLQHIVRIHKEGYIELSNGERIVVARRRMTELLGVLRAHVAE